MTPNPFPNRLYLLAPWDLPIEQPLNETDRVKLGQTLQQFLQILDQNCDSRSDPCGNRVALAALDRELASLDVGTLQPAPIPSTQTPLKPWEVADFDNYFSVSHVQSSESPSCMVWSLLMTYQIFLKLQCDGEPFDLTQTERLKAGMKSHAFLLARIFNLSLEKMS
ncbi:MAG: hypothetical protein F6K32_10490 [Desertifilum sp. SIO1I2]|nr:hypothetical protein [Desertifilum sp. SIO1I2]